MPRWTKGQLDAIYRRSRGKCTHCGKWFRRNEHGNRRYQWNVEHLVPKSQGGPDWVDNCAVSCVPHNQRKGNKFTSRDFAQLTRHIRRKGQPRQSSNRERIRQSRHQGQRNTRTRNRTRRQAQTEGSGSIVGIALLGIGVGALLDIAGLDLLVPYGTVGTWVGLGFMCWWQRWR